MKPRLAIGLTIKESSIHGKGCFATIPFQRRRKIAEYSGERISNLEANRRAAFERLVARLDKLNEVKRPRKPTRPSRGAVKRRLESKTKTSRTKAARRPVRDD